MNEKKYSVEKGQYYPQGATLYREGVNFALYSRNAEKVELLLFDSPEQGVPSAVIPIKDRDHFVWHCFVEGIKKGQLYAYRVYGPYNPELGLRFNPNRLLIDPYAKAISGKFSPNVCHLGYDPQSPQKDLTINKNSNFSAAPKCIVIDDTFDWEDDKPPAIPMQESIIYEMHVKGITAHHTSGVRNKGTFLGVIEIIPYLKRLGITAVELMPIHHCQPDDLLIKKGLTDYWGYSTLGYFAPDSRFSSNSYLGCQVNELKQMVKALHKAGIEVILDVVYNHTCEGDHLGHTYFLRGIDNPTYYMLEENKRFYCDFTGCGNTLNTSNPQVIKMVMDSLRYWVEVMHVDGFRFDLASVLGRSEGRFNPLAAFFVAIHQDPVLSRVKLIAEPWDVGKRDSFQVGNFPIDWAEWNGLYRDCVRRFIKSDAGMLGEFGYRLSGSADLYGDDGRSPYHSINFVTCHDGFTLNDVVSYFKKHNEANGEGNRDGMNENYSWNWGVEGPTSDPKINAIRMRTMKNALTILLISHGVPMLLFGDECARTQKGNNNAYCQDNEISYLDWSFIQKNSELFNFATNMIAFRKKHINLFRETFLKDEKKMDIDIPDIIWYDEMLGKPKWNDPEQRRLAVIFSGQCEKEKKARTELFIIFNMHWQEATFLLPEYLSHTPWLFVLDTSLPTSLCFANPPHIYNKNSYNANGRSVVILKRIV